MALDPGDAARARAADGGERRRQVRLAAVSSVIGTSIEWYDLRFAHISRYCDRWAVESDGNCWRPI